jgi:RNA polymerase sigma-70 factor (ECF subfamily)
MNLLSTQFYNEADLLDSLRAGNQKAFEELYDRFAPNLLSGLIRIVHDQKQAEDLLQDSFVNIWLNLCQYDPAKGRLFTWMVRITHNKALTHLKNPRQAVLRLDDLPVERMGTIAAFYNTIDFSAWINSTLSASQSQLIDLVYFQGYTHQEIADSFMLPLGTVKTRLRQAIIRLRNSEIAIDLGL